MRVVAHARIKMHFPAHISDDPTMAAVTAVTVAVTSTAVIGEIVLVSCFDPASSFGGLVSLSTYVTDQKLITLSFVNTFAVACQRTSSRTRILDAVSFIFFPDKILTSIYSQST